MTLENLARDGTAARLARTASKEAVLFIPSAQGLNGFVDDKLHELAAAGFTALAWDPFHSVPNLPADQRSKHTDTVQQDPLVQKEHLRWLDFLQKDCGAERIGVLGFCMGGRMALTLASADARVKASVGFYPTMRDPKPANVIDLPAVAPAIACPVMVHCPGKDILTSHASFHKLRAALESREGAATLMNWYPKAHHGFQSKSKAENADDHEAGLLAWPASMAFLKSALKRA